MILCIEIADDVINTQTLDSPPQELDDDDIADIGDCITIGLLCRAINTLGSLFNDSSALAEVQHNICSHFQTAEETGITSLFKILLVVAVKVASEVNPAFY